MIKTPVSRHKMFTSSFVDKFGYFLDDAQMNDAQKRINTYDELVKSLRDMFEMAGMAHYKKEWSDRYLAAEKLLERCK